MLDIVQKPELGLCKVGKEMKNFYRPWIKESIKIGLMTGRRAEEITEMRLKDITTDVKGEMLTLVATDFKVSRQQGRLQNNPKKISVPITEELKNLLKPDYEKFKKDGVDKYILADEETMSRESVKKFMSRSFSHYWKQLDASKSKDASYKTLRKTYLSSLSAAIGISNAQIISQHSDTKVLADHYVNHEVIGKTAKNFSVFSSEDDTRQKELHELRKSGKSISLEK
jgi:integrase